MTTIKVRFQQIAFHRWPKAPVHRAYLRDLHRHNFHLEVELEVFHNEREVEMHDLQNSAGRLFLEGADDDTRSCEDMAELLLKKLAARHPNRFLAVEVWEDGEVGARITNAHIQSPTSPQEGLLNAVEAQSFGAPSNYGSSAQPTQARVSTQHEGGSHSQGPSQSHLHSSQTGERPTKAEVVSTADANPSRDIQGRLVEYLSSAKRLLTAAKDALPTGSDALMSESLIRDATKFINLTLQEVQDL